MGLFDDVFDFLFGWLVPEQQTTTPAYNGGVELNLEKPSAEPLIYGQV